MASELAQDGLEVVKLQVVNVKSLFKYKSKLQVRIWLQFYIKSRLEVLLKVDEVRERGWRVKVGGRLEQIDRLPQCRLVFDDVSPEIEWRI